MKIANLVKLLEALKKQNIGLIVREHDENLVMDGYKSHRIHTSAVALVDWNNKKEVEKVSKELFQKCLESNHRDLKFNYKRLIKRNIKEQELVKRLEEEERSE